MVQTRSEVAQENCWNVEAMYPHLEAWEQDLQKVVEAKNPPYWPSLQAYKGRLGEGPAFLKELLDKTTALDRKLLKLHTYAHLRHDEDITLNSYKEAYSKIVTILHEYQKESAWFEPELLALPASTLDPLLSSPLLKEYAFYLEKIIRIKPHILPQDQEELLAMAGQPLQACMRVFSAINDADFIFGTAQNKEGESLEITHATYGLFLRDSDRTLRKNAFLQLHRTYQQYENTLCELLNGTIQNHLFQANARHYSSCLEAALFPKNIDPAVYHALIQAINEEIGVLHQYVGLRKNMPGVDRLHLYDMYAPLTMELEMHISYPEAEALVIESVAPLGAEYQNILKKGLMEQRWVDRYENKNKRSGAYSSGCYDSMPYILMNYKGILRDVYTLAHEVGHSMHSELSRRSQPYPYASYSIFLAEVASTFNEDLLSRLMIERAQSKEEKIYLLTQKLEDLRGTLFRQTMFAEFELFIHQMAEQHVPLTPKLLREKFLSLNAHYFGPAVIIDPEAEVEWARIPHFYYNFYVYQYATGISAALALSERVVNGGDSERNAYLNFLKGGSSKYPIEMLHLAGVDMRTPQPVKAVIKKFSALLEELKTLL
jgi:oligoendopeptidase F